MSKTVLVVERDRAEARKIKDFFVSHKFRSKIKIVKSQSEALDYVFGTGKYQNLPDHEAPGLILLDLLTNKTPDVKLLKPLQSYLRTQDIPLVILTSSEEQEREVSEHQLGVVGFIRKPLDFTHFVEVIRQLGISIE